MITPGIYRHYKGGEYRVLFIVQDSTNSRIKDGVKNDMVVYISLTKGSIWCRDLSEFEENVDFEGQNVPRFTFVRAS